MKYNIIVEAETAAEKAVIERLLAIKSASDIVLDHFKSTDLDRLIGKSSVDFVTAPTAGFIRKCA